MIRPIAFDCSYMLAFGFLSKQVCPNCIFGNATANFDPMDTMSQDRDAGAKKVGERRTHFPRVRTECSKGLDDPLGIKLQTLRGGNKTERKILERRQQNKL